MPDGTRYPESMLDDCSRLMTRVTRHWAELDASGPRAGPVREAISKLEPVVFAQMFVAIEYWVRTMSGDQSSGPSRDRLGRLAAQIMAPEEKGDPELGPPHLTSIDFVQLWPKVMQELRDHRSGAPAVTGSSGPSTPSP